MNKASQLRQRAQNYVKKGRLDSAVEEYRKLIQVESRNPNLYNELGDLHLKAGDRVQAVSSFEKASVLYEKVALYNNAIAVCKKILRVVPNRLDTIYKLGELKAKQKFAAEAEAYFTQYLNALLADPSGNVEGVQAKLELMLEYVPDRSELVTTAAELYQRLGFKVKSAELLTGLLARLEEQGETEAARRCREKIDSMKSSFSSEELSQLTKQLGASAKGDEAQEKEPKAHASEKRGAAPSRAQPPGPAPAAPAAGLASSGARPAATVASSRTEPPSSAAQPPAASSDRTHAARDAAGIAQEVLIAEEPQPAPETEPAGEERCEETAEERFEAARDEEPERAVSDGEAADGARCEQARFHAPEETEEARSFAREITSDVEEDDYRSHYDLGMAYIEMALYDESIKELQIASRSEQLYLRSIEMIGHCFLMQNKPRLAVKQLERVLSKAREAGVESLGINYNLGLAYEMLDDHEKAREHFEEVYIIDVTFRDIAEKMARYGTQS